MATTTPPVRTEEVPGAAAAVAMLLAELNRADTKAALLLALHGGLLAGAGGAVTQIHPPAIALAVGAIGAATVLAAIVCMLLAVLPVLTGPGWPQWHTLTDTDLKARLAAGTKADEVRALQASALRKFTRVRHGVIATLTGIAFLTTAAILAAL
ncbi:MAG: DUF5706 domain-containing protein [Streptomyces sp.]|jgi:hypothetical protein|nr:DUF5706 domain-containing protein [Streptomyces sp.]